MRATMLLFTLVCHLRLVASSTPAAQSQITSRHQADAIDPLRDQRSKRQDFPPSPAHHMHPETAFWDDDFASPADFQKAADKGGALNCALLGSDRTAGLLLKDKRNSPSAASIWTGDLKTELQEWYWRVQNPTSKGSELSKYWQIGAALQELGLDGTPDSEGGDNVCYRIEHWDPTREEGGKQIPAINQRYQVSEKDYRVSQVK